MSYVGYTGVANQAQTTPGCATGVVADADDSYGDNTGGDGVVDTFSCLVPPVHVEWVLVCRSCSPSRRVHPRSGYRDDARSVRQKGVQGEPRATTET